MKGTISCEMELIEDQEYRCVIVALPKDAAEHFLLLLDALTYNRIDKIECRGAGRSLLLSRASNDGVIICIPELVQGELSCNQVDLLKCCSIDCAFGNYGPPHVDLEFGNCDVTVLFR